MMRTSDTIIKNIFPYLIIAAVAVASCGSYQTSYGDGIYEDSVVQRKNRNVAPQQPRTVSSNPDSNNQNYKNYFESKSKQYEGRSSDIFTDIDSYSSSTPNGERSGDAPQNQKTNHPGWGGGVTDVYLDSGFDYQMNYGWGLNSGYWAMNPYNNGNLWNYPSWTRWNTFNNRPWGYGGYGWNNWGWNNGFYGSFWGYGNVWVNNGFYCPSDYYGIPSNGYVMPSNIYVANRTRRGLYDTRSARNYNVPTNGTYNDYASRRRYGSSNYNTPNLVSSKAQNQLTPANSRRQNYRANNSNTGSKIIRQNSDYSTRRNNANSNYSTRNNSSINRRNSNTTRQRSSSNTFRSRSNNSSMRSSGSRSSSGSRRSGGRQ